MNTYLTLTRIILFFVTSALVILGALAFVQHWSFGRPLLTAGLLLTAVMLADFYKLWRNKVSR